MLSTNSYGIAGVCAWFWSKIKCDGCEKIHALSRDLLGGEDQMSVKVYNDVSGPSCYQSNEPFLSTTGAAPSQHHQSELLDLRDQQEAPRVNMMRPMAPRRAHLYQMHIRHDMRVDVMLSLARTTN